MSSDKTNYTLVIFSILIGMGGIYLYNEKKISELENKIQTINTTTQINPDEERRVALDKRDVQALVNPLMPPERRVPEYEYPEKPLINVMNVPTRGLPENYHMVGIVSRQVDERIMQLFGRQKYPGSNQWEYYVSGKDMTGNSNKVPIDVKADRELMDGDSVDLPWMDPSKGQFTVKLYDYDVPRYNPFIY